MDLMNSYQLESWHCFQVAELRGLARECMKTDRSTEAFLHLSHALRWAMPVSTCFCKKFSFSKKKIKRLDADNRDLLVERSRVCSGEACQYHFAMEVPQFFLLQFFSLELFCKYFDFNPL